MASWREIPLLWSDVLAVFGLLCAAIVSAIEVTPIVGWSILLFALMHGWLAVVSALDELSANRL